MNLKAKFDNQKKKYRIIIPASITGTGKRQCLFFETKEKAEEKAKSIREHGIDPVASIGGDILAVARLIVNRYGGDAAEVFRNLDFAEKTIGAIPLDKRVDLETACIAFVERQKREQKNRRTVYSDRQSLKYFCRFAGAKTPLMEITEAKINQYFDTMKPGGRRRTQHSRIKKFFNWCTAEGACLGLNPMARIKPREKWNSNNEILEIETFRRLLFVIAGLESIKADEPPTTRYRRLLPFYVLGGLAGVRRIEIISSNPRDPVIEWTDILWAKNLVVIRKEVGKTGLRYIPLEPAAKEWLLMAAQPTGPIVEISQSTLQRLNDELLDALDLKVPDNGLRNSYASYAQSFRTPGDVAKAMGDNEATVKRYYIEPLEPGSGKTWFQIRPGTDRKIIQMEAAG